MITFGVVINFRNVFESVTCLSVMPMFCGFLGWHLGNVDLDATFCQILIDSSIKYFS